MYHRNKPGHDQQHANNLDHTLRRTGTGDLPAGDQPGYETDKGARGYHKEGRRADCGC
jgi:hypothetical protein